MHPSHMMNDWMPIGDPIYYEGEYKEDIFIEEENKGFEKIYNDFNPDEYISVDKTNTNYVFKMKDFLLFCHHCKKEFTMDVENFAVKVVENDKQSQN